MPNRKNIRFFSQDARLGGNYLFENVAERAAPPGILNRNRLMPQINWQTTLLDHDRWLRKVVLARVGESGAVDEVMQEVALAAVRQQTPIADAAKVAPWLYRVAVTQALQYRRRQGRRRNLTARYARRERPVEHDARVLDPLEWLLADERQDLVRQAIAELPRRDVEILLLKYSESWSYEQLAQHLGTTESAVEGRLFRARRRLRARLAAFEGVGVEP